MEYKWIAQDKNGLIVKYYDTEPTIGERDVGFINGYKWTLYKEGKPNSNWRESLINLKTHDYKIEDGILMQVEKEQIIKGSELQYKDCYGEWQDCHLEEYRIKPQTKTVRFRNYIDGEGRVCSWGSDNFNDPVFFTRWLGDWQEVEVPDEQ